MAEGRVRGLVVISRRCAKQREVLQFAQKAFQPEVGLQGQVLRILVADRAEATTHFANGNDGTTEPAG